MFKGHYHLREHAVSLPLMENSTAESSEDGRRGPDNLSIGYGNVVHPKEDVYSSSDALYEMEVNAV